MKLFTAAGKDSESDSVPECSTEWRESCAATLMTTVCRVSYYKSTDMAMVACSRHELFSAETVKTRSVWPPLHCKTACSLKCYGYRTANCRA